MVFRKPDRGAFAESQEPLRFGECMIIVKDALESISEAAARELEESFRLSQA